MTKINKDLNIYMKKTEIAEKRLDDEKQKNFMIQNKLDKKGKELQELNEYTKKLLTNKDNLITQYEEKIEEITKDKNDLITQNKQLLENIKLKKENAELNQESNTNTEEKKEEDNSNTNDNKTDIQQYIHENKLLTEEIKELKEQLEIQAKDLIDLNSFEKEIVRLRAQNESLNNDNKDIKKQLEDLKNKEQDDIILEEEETTSTPTSNNNRRDRRDRKRGLTIMTNNNLKMLSNPFMGGSGRKGSRESQMSRLNYEKKLNALKKIQEEEKKDYEDRINKIYLEIASLKYKNLNLEYKNDELNIRYKNLIKSITTQCNKKGIKINISSD